MTQAEAGGLQPEAKAHQGLPAATGRWERDLEQILPQSPQKEADFRRLTSRNVRE